MAKGSDNQAKMQIRPPGGGRPMIPGKVEKAKDFKGTLRKLMVYIKPYRSGFIAVLIFAVLSTGFAIAGPKIIGLAVDKLYQGIVAKMNHVPGAAIDFTGIFTILAWLFAIYVLSAVMNYIQEYMMAGISQKMMRKMREDVSSKLHKLPLNYYDTKAYGDILSRITNDIDTINTTLAQNLIQVISSAILLIGITIMMLFISPVLSLVAFLVLPMGFLITAFIAKKSQKHFEGQQKMLGKLNGYIEETFGGHMIVKAFNYEEKSLDEFKRTNQSLYNHGWKAQFVTGIIYPLLNFVSNLAFVGVCVLGGYMTAIGRISLGSVQAFISYSRQFSQPIMQVANIVNMFQSTIAAAERVFEVLDEKEEIKDIGSPIHLAEPKGEVFFDNISFSYDPAKPLIENLSIHVKPGQVIAIVGPTGAGKTTLVNLLMRFYELDKGTIYIDSVDIKNIKRKELRRLFGMVLQDTWLFNGTIRDNIAYGKRGATDEDVVNAAKISLADTFIRTLPKGYDTMINEEGGNISQGQKQLLTIARAVLADPPIMILDEATSSVDTRTEILLQQAMVRLMHNRTSFVIAHRLSTIHNADCILVMDKGSIVESGTHEELLDKKGFYYSLYNSQFSQNS